MDATSTTLLVANITYKATIIAALIGIGGTALGYWLNFYFDNKKRIEERHVDETRKAFSKLLSLLLWYDVANDKEELNNMKEAVSNTELFGSKELNDKMYEALRLMANKKWDKSRNNPIFNEIKVIMKKELKIKQ